MANIFLMQIVALVRKDFQIMASHRRRMLSELLSPFINTCIFCLLVVVIAGDISIISQLLNNFQGYMNGWYWNDFLGMSPPIVANYSNNASGWTDTDPWSSNYGGCYSNGPCWTPYESAAGFETAYAEEASRVGSNSFYNVMGYMTNIPQDAEPPYPGTLATNVTAFFNQNNGNTGTFQTVTNKALDLTQGPDAASLWNGTLGFNSNSQLFNYNPVQMIATGGALMLCAVFFVPLGANTAGRLVDEKKNKVREHLKVMGVNSAAYLIGNLTTALIRVTVAVVSMLIILLAWGHKALPVSEILLIGVIMEVYGLSVCAFATIMPALFSRSMISNAAMSIFLTFSAIGGVFVTTDRHAAPQTIVGLVFSPATAVYAIGQIAGLRGCTLPIAPAVSIVILLWNTLLYAALGEYLYAINPGDYGVPKHPLFPLYALLRLCGVRRSASGEAGGASSGEAATLLDNSPRSAATGAAAAADLYDASATQKERIIIDGLTKYFGTQRDEAAVDDLTLSIKSREIFALLGHNGAGKTTTISMLTGMIAATNYRRCSIEGYDVDTEMDQIRRSIACCPQFDVLYDDLSGLQHMQLYAAIKGVPAVRAIDLLERLSLPLTMQKSSEYSGGMKRRLSVGTALVGGSNVLFLDEPSSGLDPLSRRKLWQLLKDERERGKTIILTTHFMEEADYLGDRIAIMSHGRLICCDTSTALKQTHGVGYYLRVVKDAQAIEDGRTLRTDSILQQCNRVCDGAAKLHNETNSDALFLLPSSAVDRYAELLEWLEANLTALHATSYGMSMNSLDDVFVSVSETQEAARKAERHKRAGTTAEEENFDTTVNDIGMPVHDIFAESSSASVFGLFVAQVWAIVLKKLYIWRRTPRLLFMSCIAPSLFVVVAFFAAIPNFVQNGDAQPFTYSNGPTALPDMRNPLTILVSPKTGFFDSYGFQERTGSIDQECVHDFIDMLTHTWSEYQEAHVDPYVTFPLKVRLVTDAKQIQTGTWVDLRSISWLAKAGHPAVMTIMNCPSKNNVRVPGEPFEMDFGWMYDFFNLSPQGIYIYNTLATAALRKLGNHSRVFPPTPRVRYEPLPAYKQAPKTLAPGVTTPAPTPAPTHRHHGDDDDSNGPPFQTYFTPMTGVLLVVGVAQFAASAGLQVADELNKGTMDTLRMHGAMASAYWIGTWLFDLCSAIPMMILVLTGPWYRGIRAMQYDCTWSANTFYFAWLVAFALLGGYAIVASLPRKLKHSTYIAAVYVSNLAMMGLPFAIFGIAAAASDAPISQTSVDIMTYMSPQRAFMSVIMLQDNLNWPNPACAWDTHAVEYSAITFSCWFVVPMAVLAYVSHSDMLSRATGDEADRNNGDQAALATATFTSEQQLQHGGSMLPRDTDPDVAREYDRVARQLAEHYHKGQAAAAPAIPHQQQPATMSDSAAAATLATNTNGSGEPGAIVKPPVDGVPVTNTMRNHQHAKDMCLVKDLQKIYNGNFCLGSPHLAVRSLSFGLKRGECFGLLGPNGAGKTTTVKMMLREHVATSGIIESPYAPEDSVQGSCCIPVASRGSLYRGARLGVCPQHDALWDALNAEEHIHLYLRIRLGLAYKYSDWATYVQRALAKVQLSEGGEKASEKFSGGMKRKLQVCIAMYTGASTVFLDEPSTGMDPHARRALWKSIHEALQDDRCVLLTTHSMDEADAVCARIAIVTDGLMRCIGSGQHLKNRHGSGYAITVTLRPIDGELNDFERESQMAVAAAKVDAAMMESFGSTACKLQEVLGAQRKYAVSTLPSVAQAFRTLSDHREEWALENYSVSQLTSLEQVFLDFAGTTHLAGN